MSLFRTALLLLFAATAACSYDPAFDVACDTEGATEGGRTCVDGVWVSTTDGGPILDATGGTDATDPPDDAGPGGDDAGDMGGDDMPCVPESNDDFCIRLDLDCGEVTADDNCGEPRTITCGMCEGLDTCGAVEPNKCGCVAEGPVEFCERLVKTCEDVTAPDNCGDERTENCGTCTPPATCGGGLTDNVCACPDQTDADFCNDAGALCGAFTGMDECGQMRTTNCGMCTSPQECGATTANQCDCPDDTTLCSTLNVECGMVDVSAECGGSRMANCGGCQANASCTSNSCVCNAGFSPDGRGNCEDDDECTDMTDNCDQNASCTNTPGGFDCTCDNGYIGDGTSCSDFDECADPTDNNCDQNATCTNEVGSFSCMCDSGFTGDGVTCTDDDECADMTDNCDQNATCTNTPGSFTCECNAGYTGNGVTCMPNSVVVSVQTVSGALPDGTSSDSFNLSTTIDSANAIPFISLRTEEAELRRTTVDVVLNDDTVDVSRGESTGDIDVVIAIVEFDPARVAVQTGSFGGEGNNSITSVDTSASFLTFAGSISDNDDRVDDRMISGHFNGADSVQIGRAATAGSLSGHYWVAESLDGTFSVQHVNGSLTGANDAVITITAVDPAQTFLVYSNRSTENGTELDDGTTACVLTNATTVTCGREGNGPMLTDLHVQVVEVIGASVQRGSESLAGTDTVGTDSISAVDLTRSIVNPGQTGSNGVCRSDEQSNNGFPTAAATVELADQTTVETRRDAAADGLAECTWEVVEWP